MHGRHTYLCFGLGLLGLLLNMQYGFYVYLYIKCLIVLSLCVCVYVSPLAAAFPLSFRLCICDT